VRNTTLFRGSEQEVGHFVITANTTDLDSLKFFGLRPENISSIAWLLAVIDPETDEIRDFMLAASFPVTEEWAGIPVGTDFSASSGILMWVARQDDAAYLCTFNGSETLIQSDVTVSVDSGSLISDSYTLNVSSGECSYFLLGYNLSGVEVRLDDTVLHSESGGA
jgi:hypothetical protein